MNTDTEEITTSDILDVRDIIARFEYLEDECRPIEKIDGDPTPEEEEREKLRALLEELAGNGGDEQWNGVWYPVTLIRESYFEDYARELAEDIGAINSDGNWPNNCIDWKQAAEQLSVDYTTVEFDGVTYYYR